METRDKIISLTEKNNEWRKQCINLIASENTMSPLAEKMYCSDFMHRYAEGDPFERYYEGTKYIDEIEVIATDLMKELFQANHADVRTISGTISNLSVYKAFGKPGEIVMSNRTFTGGHISHAKLGAVGVRGMKSVYYDFDDWEINLEDAKKKALENQPKIIMIGNSLYLFPVQVKEMKEIADEIGATLVYDAAHVLGLIGGKKFQDPLREGAEVMTSSTHKTFPGPQGGIVFCEDDEKFKRIKRALFPGLLCNHHLHRLPALAITALEMKKFGEEYATQIISNAKALGQAMNEEGFKVLAENRGFTESHQIAVDVGDGDFASKACAENNIILNKNLIPRDDPKMAKHPSGVRIGVQEMTRYGMKESEMKEIAELLKKVILEKKNVVNEVEEFRKGFQKINYCFK